MFDAIATCLATLVDVASPLLRSAALSAAERAVGGGAGALAGDPADKEEAMNKVAFHQYQRGPQILGPCEDVRQRMSQIAKALKIAAGEMQGKSQ